MNWTLFLLFDEWFFHQVNVFTEKQNNNRTQLKITLLFIVIFFEFLITFFRYYIINMGRSVEEAYQKWRSKYRIELSLLLDKLSNIVLGICVHMGMVFTFTTRNRMKVPQKWHVRKHMVRESIFEITRRLKYIYIYMN